jgi:hypothetical protein
MIELLKTIWIILSVISVIFTVTFVYFFIRNIRIELGSVDRVENFKNTLKLVYIEHINGCSYMYDRITNHFICQAESDEAVLARAKELFPDHKIDVKNLKDLIKIPKEINNLKSN